MEESFATRLKLFIETEGLTNAQFADLCEIPRPSLSQIISGRNKKISDLLIGAIHKAYPKLNVLWLMFGEGDMFGAAYSGSSGTLPDSEDEFPDEDDTYHRTEPLMGAGEVPLTAGAGIVNSNSPGYSSHASNMGFENPANTPARSNLQSESKENGLTHPQNGSQTRMNTQIEANYKIMNLQRQIDEMRQNPRRVTQITIYYDDSTFETFIPGTPKS